MNKKISELQIGDLVDLEGDMWADPENNKPELEFEYSEVIEIEKETDDCICIYTTNDAFGFPPNHTVPVLDEE